MRISDWSSDVCSSDLSEERQQQHPQQRIAHRHRAARHRPQRGARDPGVESAVDDVVIDAPRAAHDDRAEQPPEEARQMAPRPAELRKAAVRERVGQDVWVVGEGENLKKIKRNEKERYINYKSKQ